MINPKIRRQCAAWLVILTLIGWPITILWLAKDEQPFILSLSWLALTLTALDILATTDVREKEEGK